MRDRGSGKDGGGQEGSSPGWPGEPCGVTVRPSNRSAELVGQEPGGWGIGECAIHTVTAEEGETGGSCFPRQLGW